MQIERKKPFRYRFLLTDHLWSLVAVVKTMIVDVRESVTAFNIIFGCMD